MGAAGRHIVLFPLLILMGCADDFGGNSKSIYRTVNLAQDGAAAPSVVVDANQRIITNTAYQGDRIICTEPSPDVAQGISEALQLALAGNTPNGAGASASATHSSAVAVAQLGERLATIQLLRDELSDLCRAYANGAVGETTYLLRLSKLDDKVVTLLMGEVAAGAFGRPLAGISGAAGSATLSAPTQADLDKLQGEIRAKEGDKGVAESRLATARAQHNASTATPRPVELVKAVTDAEEAVARLDAELRYQKEVLAAKQAQIAAGVVSATVSQAGDLRQSGQGEAKVSEEIRNLQQAYLDGDDLTILLNACIASTESRVRRGGDPAMVVSTEQNGWSNLCVTRLIPEIQGALIAQQVRMTQLQALKVTSPAEERATRAEAALDELRRAGGGHTGSGPVAPPPNEGNRPDEARVYKFESLKPEQKTEIHRVLQQLGYLDGSVKSTEFKKEHYETAVRVYQTRKGAAPTGELTTAQLVDLERDLIERLDLTGAAAPAAQ